MKVLNNLELKILHAANMSKHILMKKSTLTTYLSYYQKHKKEKEGVARLLTLLANVKEYRHLFPAAGLKYSIKISTETVVITVVQRRIKPFNLEVRIKETDNIC